MSRKSHLLRVYGITESQYQELFDAQGGRCAICSKHQSELKNRLSVDHCHKTNEIRSLLCTYCNLWVVGKLRKDTIQPIYDYLNREYTGWFVPAKIKKKKRGSKRKRRNSRSAKKHTTNSI